ncbi:hypothetical protein [Mesoterricola sediminis]|uniref:DUF4394 domain-containing protein n=1 Tax=Mesoterricola sediminis TaxID=2927980 RepID=A0AA48H9A4_9BACT|nr:hypothetical protein [Mesoterricola sediminis]BDU78283.1 hypothetical protein METESE_32410 [Mesoterricola sediminis]
MTRPRLLLAVPALLALLAATACVDPKPGDTSRTMVYVYDETGQQVLVWNDVNALYDAASSGTAAPSPDRVITSSALLTGRGAMAWGGMALNPSAELLYLVYENGAVVRISNVANQSGNLSNVTDIVSFNLGNSSSTTDHYSNYYFDQAALDPTTGTLYALEKGNSSASRIWVVASPAAIANNTTLPLGTVIGNDLTSDTGGSGLTAGSSGTVLAWFKDGNQVPDALGTYYTGFRARLSSGGSFALASNVIIGTQALLGDTSTTWASLAFDSANNRVYILRQLASGNPVIAFNQSQFTIGTLTQTPYASLPDGSLPNLRTLAHARTKDWMAGADVVTGTGNGTGTNILRLWKGPSTGTVKSVAVSLGAGVAIKGIALDGSL